MNKILHIQDVAFMLHKKLRHEQSLGGKKKPTDEECNCISLGVISKAQNKRNQWQQE